MTIHIVMTCRDPSGANAVTSVIDRISKIPDCEILLLSQSPATQILNNQAETLCQKSNITRVDFTHQDKTQIQSYLIDIFRTLNPKILITTTSGPDYGIDEIATYTYSDIKSIIKYTIQCYWGDINTAFNVLPDCVFVCDELAVFTTASKHPQLRIVQTGYINEELFRTYPIFSKREYMRHTLSHPEDKNAIVFFSQPLSQYGWYWKSVDDLASAYLEIANNSRLYIKSHPKDTSESNRRLLHCFKDKSIEATDLSSCHPLDTLCLSDVAISLFSTVGSDLQKLLANTDVPFSVPFYLFHNQRAQQWFKTTSGLNQLPLTDNSLAFVSQTQQSLAGLLKISLEAKVRSKCHSNIKKYLTNECYQQDPAEIIVSCLLEGL